MLDRDVYEYYRVHRRAPSKTICQYNYWIKAMNGIFEVLEEMILESEGGVYIENFGYFAHYIELTKKFMVNYNKKKGRPMIPKKRYRFHPHFFPDERFERWSMDNTIKFNNYRRRRTGRTGIRYKLHFELIKAIKPALQLGKQTKGWMPYKGKKPLNR